VSTAADFKRLALSFAGAEEGAHMGAVDFRVGGRIFATLAAVKIGYGNVMLTPEQQQAFVAERPDVFLPVAGRWGEGGVTHIRLSEADDAIVRGALEAAWRHRLARNTAADEKKSRARRPGRETKSVGRGRAARAR
jgi:hypothetical protein